MADLLDTQLPVFPFRINWREGIVERGIWKTAVMTGDTGNEQRQALRLSPRREFDVTLTLFDRERAFHDLWLHRMVANEIMFPVWHDATRTTAAAIAGATALALDTTYLEYQAGGMAILIGEDAFLNETVQIDTVTDAGITLTAPLRQRWPKGSRIAPMLRGFLSEEGSTATRSTPSIWEAQARLETNRPNDLGLGLDDADQYLGLPVMTTAPDAAEDTAYDFGWAIEELDNDTGRKERLSVQGAALASQKITHLLQGRAGKARFRNFLYRRQGRLAPLWLPTFNRDLVLAADAPIGQGFIEIRQTGYRYTGGAIDGRKHIAVKTRSGTSYHEVTDAVAASSGAREKLLISPALPRTVTNSNLRMISFMDTARLDSDQIEMHHATDADGATTVQLPYKTFRNNRTAPTPISLPIPAAAKSAGYCGASAPPEADPCNPFVQFDGWWMKARFDFWANPSGCGPDGGMTGWLVALDNDIDVEFPVLQGVSATDGSTFGDIEMYAGDHENQGYEFTFYRVYNGYASHGHPDGTLKFGTDFTRVPHRWQLHVQFGAGEMTCSPASGRLLIRRWDEMDFTPVAPVDPGQIDSPPYGVHIGNIFASEYEYFF